MNEHEMLYGMSLEDLPAFEKNLRLNEKLLSELYQFAITLFGLGKLASIPNQFLHNAFLAYLAASAPFLLSYYLVRKPFSDSYFERLVAYLNDPANKAEIAAEARAFAEEFEG